MDMVVMPLTILIAIHLIRIHVGFVFPKIAIISTDNILEKGIFVPIFEEVFWRGFGIGFCSMYLAEKLQTLPPNNKNPPLGANRGLKAAVLPRLVIAGGFLNCKARPEGRGIQPRALQ